MNKKNSIVKNRSANDKKNYQLYIFIALIIFFVIFSYYRAVNFQFTNWDDEEMVLNNPMVTSLSFGNIINIFTNFHHSHYHPLVILSYAFEYSLFDFNATVYHSTNIILHLLNSVLVFLIFRKFFPGNSLPALFISILFAVHPLHTESVVWITERKDMLYSFFYLISILFYIKFKKQKNYKYYNYVYLFFILSCLSKASAVTLPLLLIAIDYYNENKITFNQFKSKLFLIITSVIFGIINIIAQYSKTFAGIELEIPHTAVYEKFLIASYNFWFYIYKTIIPYNLSAFYTYPFSESENLPLIFYISPFITAAIVIAVIYFKKYSNKIFFGFIIYTVTILPVLQIVPIGRAISADRFAYIPVTGIFLIITVIIYKLYIRYQTNKIVKKVILTGSICLLLLFSYLTNNQSQIWQNSMTLYSDMIIKNPDNAVAYNNRGTLYLKNGDNINAENDFNNAINLNPKYAAAYNNMGLLLHNKNNYDNAVGFYTKAIELNSNFSEAYFNLGFSYFRMGEIDKAIEFYNKSLTIDKNFSIAYNNLGNAYLEKGKINEAIFNYSKAIETDPDYSAAHYNLAVSYFKAGNNTQGLNSMKNAAKLKNNSAIEFLRTNNIQW